MRVVRGVLGVLGVLAVLGVRGAAQAPRDGVITGQVVDGTTGKPVSAAIVSIAGSGMTVNTGMQQLGQPRILTNADGRFVFRNLAAPGTFSITATKGGYADGAPGRRRPDGGAQPIELSDARKIVDTVVRIWKNGAIAGTVTDEAGEPVVGVQVRVLGWTTVGGRRRISPGGAPVTTDDRGMYRAANLVPGEYVVMASPPLVSMRKSVYEDVARTGRGSGAMPMMVGPNAATAMLVLNDVLLAIPRGAPIPPPPVAGRLQVYPTTFHPSTFASAQAAGVTLGSGEERTGIDVQLRPVPTARVSGMLMAASGPVAMSMVALVSATAADAPPELQASGAFTDASGAFTFAAVIPGQYSLRATTASGVTEQGWVDLPITVAGDDIDNVVAMMNPPLQVTARMQFDGATPRPDASRVMFVGTPFTLDDVDSFPQAGPPLGRTGNAAAGGGFTLGGFKPGRYLVRVPNSPQGWMFKSAMLDGVDVSEMPFQLTSRTGEIVISFTDRWSGMSGAVQGTGNDGAAVIVFPTDAQRWNTPAANPRRLRLVRSNARGEFAVSSLPPGDYFVVAIPDDDSDGWRAAARLDALSRVATQVTVLEGQHKTLDLRMSEVRR